MAGEKVVKILDFAPKDPNQDDWLLFVSPEGKHNRGTVFDFAKALVGDLDEKIEEINEAADKATAAAQLAGDKMPAMTLVSLQNITNPLTSGVYIKDSNIQGMFILDNASTVVVDNVMAINDASGNKWVRRYGGFIDVKWFVKGDGTDESVALQKAIDTAQSLGLPLQIIDIEIRCINIYIKCDIYGDGILRSTSTIQTGQPTARIYVDNITVRGTIFDGNVSADPTTEDGWAATFLPGGLNSTFTGSTALMIGDGWNTSNITLIDVTVRNSKNVNLRITGRNHRFLNVTSYHARGVFGDCYYLDSAENIHFAGCRAEDFTRMGFCTDLSSGKSCINVTYNDCIAHYGHHNSAAYYPAGQGNLNGGFWAEGATEVKYTNCSASEIWGVGFVFSVATLKNVNAYLSRNSVMYSNCTVTGTPESYRGDSAGFDCKSYYAAEGQIERSVYANYVSCKTDRKRAGFRIWSRNAKDEINYTNCHAGWAADGDYSFGFLIDPGVNNAAGENLVVNMLNCSTSSFLNTVDIKNMARIMADVTVARAPDSNIGSGSRKVDLSITNFSKLGDIAVIKSVYGDYLDNINIHNSNVFVGGYPNSLRLQDCNVLFPDTSGSNNTYALNSTINSVNRSSTNKARTFSFRDCNVTDYLSIVSGGGKGGSIRGGEIIELSLSMYNAAAGEPTGLFEISNVRFIGDINAAPMLSLFDGNNNAQLVLSNNIFALKVAPIDDTKYIIGNNGNSVSISGQSNYYDSRVVYTNRFGASFLITPNYMSPMSVSRTGTEIVENRGLVIDTGVSPEGAKFSARGKMQVNLSNGDFFIKKTDQTVNTGWETVVSSTSASWTFAIPSGLTSWTGVYVKNGRNVIASASVVVASAGTYNITLPYRPQHSFKVYVDSDCIIELTTNSTTAKIISTNAASKNYSFSLNFIQYA